MEAIKQVSGALENCIGFTDGTVIGIAISGDNEAQKISYNVHKRKHELKYQAITESDGLMPFKDSNLNAADRALNKTMATVRATVEWMFKEVKL